MKTLDECLDEMMDDDQLLVLDTITDFCDVYAIESVMRAMINSSELNDDKSLTIFAKSLVTMVSDKLKERAIDKRDAIPPLSAYDIREGFADWKREEAA